MALGLRGGVEIPAPSAVERRPVRFSLDIDASSVVLLAGNRPI